MESAIIEGLSTPLLVADQQGRVRRGNTAAGYFWRLPHERLGEHTLQRLFGEQSLVTRNAARAIAEESSFTINAYRFEQGEGLPPLYLRVQIDPIAVSGGRVDHALIVFWDETSHQQRESASREERLMDSIGLMVRRLAHELQNPLSGVKGATQLLSRRFKQEPELTEYSGVILRELERLERLVQSLLEYGGEPPLHRTTFNLHELLDDVIWFESNAGHDVSFVRDYDPSLPDIEADRDRLHQVFLNLIRNAVDASPAGGRVSVRSDILGPWQGQGEMPFGSRVYFRVDIEDQGPGLGEDERERLFTPFFTTKRNGTGLGLAISYQLARAHGGYLRYRDANPHGAVFSVLVPMTGRA